MPIESQRSNSTSSESSDESIIGLNGEIVKRNWIPPSSSRQLRRQFCVFFFGAIILLLLFAAIVSCILLGLIVLGKVCIRHGHNGQMLPTFVAACNKIEPVQSHSRDRLLYINLVIDVDRVPECKEMRLNMSLPCLLKKERTFLTGNSNQWSNDQSKKLMGNSVSYLGPLKCRDDAFEENHDRDNCYGNAFRFAINNNGVVIPEDGVYRVHSKMAFADKVAYYVSGIIRVDSAYDGKAHAWLSCANHNGVKSGNKFSACTIDGVRRFNKGDVVSFGVTQSFRSINPFHKTTHFFIYKL